MTTPIPFNVPAITGRELEYLRDVIDRRELVGNGHYSRLCTSWMKERLGVAEALLTQSCTAALEMAAILGDIGPGDEVIMPSYTFVSMANAVVLRGGVPVFVDVRPDTLNIDENKIEGAITPRTKAIFVVHYAGIPCELDAIAAVARRHGLIMVEDAAHALLSTYRERPAGSFGDLACFSFHATKNVTSGEGGALVVNRPDLGARASVILQNGTDRQKFLAGEVDKYTWLDEGSSFMPSELTAAFLAAQLEATEAFTQDRLATWSQYHAALAGLERRGVLTRPTVPAHTSHNGHLYYVLLENERARDALIADLKARGITAPFHYVPLHSSPGGLRYGRTSCDLAVTDSAARRLVRLPLWYGMGSKAERVVDALKSLLG